MQSSSYERQFLEASSRRSERTILSDNSATPGSSYSKVTTVPYGGHGSPSGKLLSLSDQDWRKVNRVEKRRLPSSVIPSRLTLSDAYRGQPASLDGGKLSLVSCHIATTRYTDRPLCPRTHSVSEQQRCDFARGSCLLL
jgi:hypothetical protein